MALTAAVRVGQTWLKASPGPADLRGRVASWRVWPLEDWVGPAQALASQAWQELGFDVPSPGESQPFFASLDIARPAACDGLTID